MRGGRLCIAAARFGAKEFNQFTVLWKSFPLFELSRSTVLLLTFAGRGKRVSAHIK
jgi:hypothetical protein